MITNKRRAPLGEDMNDILDAQLHRYAWAHFIMDEAKKNGLDYEYAREAFRRFGVDSGEKGFPKESNLPKIADCFANEVATKVLDMERKEINDSVMDIVFHYCPAVDVWMKLGVPEDVIRVYCDIGMEGDRGICSVFHDLKMELPKTIADGDGVCEVIFRRKEE